MRRSTRDWLMYGGLAFGVYQVVAYQVNRRRINANLSQSGVGQALLPFDLYGSFFGYAGTTPVAPVNTAMGPGIVPIGSSAVDALTLSIPSDAFGP